MTPRPARPTAHLINDLHEDGTIWRADIEIGGQVVDATMWFSSPARASSEGRQLVSTWRPVVPRGDSSDTPRLSFLPTNDDRADRAENVLDVFAETLDLTQSNREPTDTMVVDLLCDLLHLCDRYGLDGDRLWGGAYRHHEAETDPRRGLRTVPADGRVHHDPERTPPARGGDPEQTWPRARVSNGRDRRLERRRLGVDAPSPSRPTRRQIIQPEEEFEVPNDGLTQTQKEVVLEVMLRSGQELLDLAKAHGLEAALRQKDDLAAKAVREAIDALNAGH